MRGQGAEGTPRHRALRCPPSASPQTAGRRRRSPQNRCRGPCGCCSLRHVTNMWLSALWKSQQKVPTSVCHSSQQKCWAGTQGVRGFSSKWFDQPNIPYELKGLCQAGTFEARCPRNVQYTKSCPSRFMCRFWGHHKPANLKVRHSSGWSSIWEAPPSETHTRITGLASGAQIFVLQ